MNEIKNIRHPEKVNKPDKISPSKPPWLKVKAPLGDLFLKTKGLLDDLNVTIQALDATVTGIGAQPKHRKHITNYSGGAPNVTNPSIGDYVTVSDINMTFFCHEAPGAGNTTDEWYSSDGDQITIHG